VSRDAVMDVKRTTTAIIAAYCGAKRAVNITVNSPLARVYLKSS